MSVLFSPLSVGSLSLDNRIVIAPMCQYSAEDGCMTDWHLIHLGQLSHSGAALLTIEATAVTPEGRISYGDVGLWSDETEAAMARVLEGGAPLVRDANRDPARPRRSQSVDSQAMGRRRSDCAG